MAASVGPIGLGTDMRSAPTFGRRENGIRRGGWSKPETSGASAPAPHPRFRDERASASTSVTRLVGMTSEWHRCPSARYRFARRAALAPSQGSRARTPAFSLLVGWLSSGWCASSGAPGVVERVAHFSFRRSGPRRLFVGAASASQFHAGPSGGQKAAGSLPRHRIGPARLRAGGLEGLLAGLRMCQQAIRILRATADLAGFLAVRLARLL